MSLAPILRFHGGGVETEVELVRSYINEIVVSKGTNANFHTGKSYTTNQLTYTRFGQLPSTRTCKGNRGPRNLGRRIPTRIITIFPLILEDFIRSSIIHENETDSDSTRFDDE